MVRVEKETARPVLTPLDRLEGWAEVVAGVVDVETGDRMRLDAEKE